MEWREFRQSAGKVCRVWRIAVKGAEIHTQWGQLDGAIQTAVETKEGVNVGKKNEISPADYAADRAEETVRKKKREGYREYQDGKCIDVDLPSQINFDEKLPESLCFYKPDNSMGPGITKTAETGKVLYSRKRNGLAYVIVKDSKGDVHMYSRRMLRSHDLEDPSIHPWRERFPSIWGAADMMLPNKSIILGELVANNHLDASDDFKHVQSVTKSLTDESIKRQSEGGDLRFYVWDIAFWDGKDLISNSTIKSRYDFIKETFSMGPSDLLPVDYYEFKSTKDAMAHLKKTGWEGFVVVDPEGVYGEKAYNFKGKPDRPRSFCAKLKPEFEDDFVVMWDPENGHGEKSTKGRYNGGIKSVSLYQYNSKGELVYIANCASGMTEEMKRDWADPKKYPMVWQVIYTDRRYISQGDETNAIDFPRFSMVREDKKPKECINTELDLEK